MSSCWDNSAKELSTGPAQRGLGWDAHTEPSGVRRHWHSALRLWVPLRRMSRMTGMLGAITNPDNAVHLRAWLAVSVVSPSIVVILKKNGLVDIVGLSLQCSSLSFQITWSQTSSITCPQRRSASVIMADDYIIAYALKVSSSVSTTLEKICIKSLPFDLASTIVVGRHRFR